MTVIKTGSNALLTRNLLQADGVTPLQVTSLTTCQVELMQKGAVKKTIVLNGSSTELRAGSNGTSLVLEYTTSIVEDDLCVGAVTERYTLAVADADYVIEPGSEVLVYDVNDVTIT